MTDRPDATCERVHDDTPCDTCAALAAAHAADPVIRATAIATVAAVLDRLEHLVASDSESVAAEVVDALNAGTTGRYAAATPPAQPGAGDRAHGHVCARTGEHFGHECGCGFGWDDGRWREEGESCQARPGPDIKCGAIQRVCDLHADHQPAELHQTGGVAWRQDPDGDRGRESDLTALAGSAPGFTGGVDAAAWVKFQSCPHHTDPVECAEQRRQRPATPDDPAEIRARIEQLAGDGLGDSTPHGWDRRRIGAIIARITTGVGDFAAGDAEQVMALRAERDQLARDVKRLRERIHEAVDECQRRHARYVSRCAQFETWSVWARRRFEERGSDYWAMTSEADRLVILSIIEERDAARAERATARRDAAADALEMARDLFDANGATGAASMAHLWATEVRAGTRTIPNTGEETT